MPGTRRFESGSASTGQPGDLGEAQHASTAARRHPSPRRRGRAAGRPTRWASASSISTDGARTPGARRGPRTAVGTTGRVDQRRHRSAPAARGTAGSGAPGPAGGPSASANACATPTRATPRPTPGRSLGTLGLVEPAHRVAEQLHLVDGLARRRCRAARAGGRRCRRSAARVRGALRAPRGGSSRRRYPTCTARLPGGPTRARGRARRTTPTARRGARAARMRSSPASASASGAEREPGARHASVTPWRTHSSTSVRAKAVVASRLMRGCLRGERTWSLVHGFTQTANLVGAGVQLVPASVLAPRRSRRCRLRGGRARAGDEGAGNVRRLLAGRASVPAARARPTRRRAAPRAGRARRPASPTTPSTRRRDASRRGARAGDRARRRRRVPRTLARAAAVRDAATRAERDSTNGAPRNTVERPHVSSCACSGRVRSRRTGSASASCGCRCC